MAAPPREVPTVCRVCESACGLVATVEGGVVTRLSPDRAHPVSKGYACVKGLSFLQVHAHPRRLTTPLARPHRSAPLAPTPWAAALRQAGGELRRVRKQHGAGAVGLFVGNAAGQSFGALLGVSALQSALGTRKLYSSLSLDNSEMYVVLDACLGSPMLSFVADYEHTDLLVLVGTDPLSSQASQAQSNPDGVRQVRAVASRGQLVVVDPRSSATAARASVHLRPRPGSDAAILAFLARGVLERSEKLDPLILGSERPALTAALAPWTAARASEATGLPVDELEALAARLATAERPLVWCGLGVLLGPEGTVGYWLTLVLQALLGGLDRPGGWLVQRGAVDIARQWPRLGTPAYDPKNRSRIGNVPAVLGAHASATLAADVLTEGPDRLRALVVVGGNPALSLPDTPRAQAALRALDLLVTVDLLPSDTVTLSDVVLPAADWLERDETALQAAHQRPHPHLARVPAVVPPPRDVRTDWHILSALARASGRPRFGSWTAELGLRVTGWGPDEVARLLVETGAPFSWEELAGAPRGLYADGSPLGGLRRRGTLHRDRKVHLAVPALLERLRVVLTAADGAPPAPHTEPAAHPDAHPALVQLLTSVRPVETMNSWLHDRPDAARRAPRLTLSSLDAAGLGIIDGDLAQLRRAGERDWRVTARVRVDAALHIGVAVLPYGWGHLPGSVGAGTPGVNANELVGTDRLEPFTGQPVSNGGWVEVMRAPPTASTTLSPE